MKEATKSEKFGDWMGFLSELMIMGGVISWTIIIIGFCTIKASKFIVWAASSF